MFEIQGKVALVTGGASGIGFSCGKELLKNGAKGIALIDINLERGQAALDEIINEFGNSRCIFIESDVSLPERFEEAFEQTISAFEQLDIVINSAGIFNERNWQKCVAVNLGGCISGTKLAFEKYLPQHKSTREGVVVNISSMCGLGSYHTCPVYCATKYGVVGLSRSLGSEENYNNINVKVMVLCPGFTLTPFLDIPEEHQVIKPLCDLPTLLKEVKMQTPEHVAENLVNIIREGTSGSVWVVKNSEPAYEVKLPKRM